MVFGFLKKKVNPTTPGHSNHYRNLVVKNIVQETPDAISIVFEQPNTRINYKSGQFLTLILTIDGTEVRRPYSFNSAPGMDADLCVTVKRVKGGLVSNWLPDHLKVGDSIRVLEPMGQFTPEFAAEHKRHLVLLAGGSGITPMLSIMKSILAKEPESSCTLVYGNRNVESIIFKAELEKLKNSHPNRVSIIHVLEHAPSGWQGQVGYLTKEILQEAISSDDLTKTYWMCGPEIFMSNAEKFLMELSVPVEAIFKENFGGNTEKKKTEIPAETKTRIVTIRYEGEELKVQVEPGHSILDSALEQGFDLPFSCQRGACTSCRGKAISGKVDLVNQEGLSQAEIKAGYVLTCVGYPLTDDVVIEIM